jgi:hypothetical protein
MGIYQKQPSSRVGRSVVTALTGATQFTTTFAANIHQIRVVTTLPIWATVGSTAVVTANSSATYIPANVPEHFTVTSGQVLNFISTSTSTGYMTFTEMA